MSRTACGVKRVAYVSLYRKYRPQTFTDVVGQQHVIQTLVHAIEEDRLHHAYLFTGPRGTGKTSTARLLAKAINCEQGPTPTPCGVCEHCTSIAEGSSVDVIELDMASHGGVDDARELRDRALYAPARARRKVYILDEVHMASTAAFNALLKLIEEPPSHVLFAMATTDPQKVLPTILSRVQRLDLRRVAAADVAGNVQRICDAEGYTIDAGAVEAIVRAGDGSLRDTQSVLEQVLAFAGTTVTAEAVTQVLGHTPADRVFETVEMVAGRDLAGLLGMVQGLLDEGHDLRRFTLDLVQHLRDLLVLQVAPDRPDLVDATDDRRRQLQAQTTAMPRESLLRAVDLLAATVVEQRQGSPRLPLELTLAKLAVPGADGDVAGLADRLARLESRAVTAAPAASAPAASALAASAAADSAAADSAPAASAPAAPSPVTAGPDAAPSPRPRAGRPPEPQQPGPADEPAPSPSGRLAPTPSDVQPEAAAPAAETPLQARARARGQGPPATSGPPGATAATEAAASEPAAEHPRPATPAGTTAEPAAPGPTTAQPTTAPPTTGAAAGAEAAADGDSELELLRRNWDGVLELVKNRSRRSHAVFLPATVTSVSRGIVILRYAQRYASFHAQNASKGEFADVLKEAIERACGLRLRVEVVIEGDDDRRRPVPPSVTPDDARTPVLDDGPSAAEEADVREAEQSAPAHVEAAATDQLLAQELGAELLEEQPAPGVE
ncbi:DNA polymerase III subunit gamma/tau [Egicoccus sp. AB-alg6-2]|uniref:DNA polymerase III subunit gamma/tau n=1 Tax=Egicoccus sp. AB-alg6-2 TaxID=3242692 RepID=UPI00359DFB08